MTILDQYPSSVHSSTYFLSVFKILDQENNRQGMAPVLEMAMVAKLLMRLIDTPMMWDVQKKKLVKIAPRESAKFWFNFLGKF